MWNCGEKWSNAGGVFSSFTLCQAKYVRSLKNPLVKLKKLDHKNNYLSSKMRLLRVSREIDHTIK